MLDEHIPNKLNEHTKVAGEDEPEVVPNDSQQNNYNTDSAARKTNPTKIIGLIIAVLVVLLLCCCCCAVLFLPGNFVSEQTIQDLCAILETEGVEETYGLCE